jgi:hypothetical protein
MRTISINLHDADFEVSVKRFPSSERLQAGRAGWARGPLRAAAGLGAACCFVLAAPAAAGANAPPPPSHPVAEQVKALQAQVRALGQRLRPPELGHQMLELQIRHDRLWWAGEAGNWNLAYFMVGELGEALRGIEASNGDAPELQPQKLSAVMPAVMNPAVQGLQQALARHDKADFERAFDRLSAACTACHAIAGDTFLHIQRPSTPLLDNLRYAPGPGR